MFDFPQPDIRVTHLVEGEADGWGDRADSYGPEVPLADAVAVPRSSSETPLAGYENRVITDLTLLWFDDVAIGAKDRVKIGDDTYLVEGRAGDYRRDPLSGPWAGQQVALKLVED